MMGVSNNLFAPNNKKINKPKKKKMKALIIVTLFFCIESIVCKRKIKKKYKF